MESYKIIMCSAITDIGGLEIRNGQESKFLPTGEDGSFKIYCTTPGVVLPNHYKLALEVAGNIELLDDEALICKASNAIACYRAGRSIILVGDIFEFPKSFEEAVNNK